MFDQPQANFYSAAMHPAVFHAAAMHPAVLHAAAMHPAVFYAAAMHPAVLHAAAMHPAVFHAAAMQPVPLTPRREKELRELTASYYEQIAKIIRESIADIEATEEK